MERRKNRSEKTQLASRYLLESVLERFPVRAATIASLDGLLVEGVSANEEDARHLELIAATSLTLFADGAIAITPPSRYRSELLSSEGKPHFVLCVVSDDADARDACLEHVRTCFQRIVHTTLDTAADVSIAA